MPVNPQAGYKIDQADADYSRLLKAADRLSSALENAENGADQTQHLVATLDLFLGAIYALILAKLEGYQNRDGTVEFAAIQKRMRDVAGGWLRTDGPWFAGFHFNSALARIAAVYHRLLKLALGQTKGYVPVLRPKVKKLYPLWTDDKTFLVHLEINGLKHDPGGLYATRLVKVEDAINAIDELVSLIELRWGESQQSLS